MGEVLPKFWDAWTLMWAFGLAVGGLAWFGAAFTSADWVWRRFEDATSGYVRWMRAQFDRMFLDVPASWCSASIVASVLVFAALGLLLTSGLPWAPWGYHIIRALLVAILVFGPFGLPVGYNLPRFVVERMWDRRLQLFEDQMLDALAFMSNGLKSGLSLLQCMDMVRDELPDPIAQEFALTLNEQRLGVPLEEALLNLERRVGSEDIQIVVTSINILRVSGGNLSETFDTVAATIRERKKVEGRIASLTAQGVAQGVVITAMPFVLAFVLYLMDPVLISRLWTTWLGWVFLLVMLALQITGGWMIRRFVTIRV